MKSTDIPPTFESMLAELEVVVRELEDGAISLDDALARYEKGVGLLRICFEKLKSAEQKIQQLTGVDEVGQPLLQSVHGGNSSETASPPRRGRKRDATLSDE